MTVAEDSGNIRANLVLGTAGHIDHGKSSLILALTGTDPDRLSEEKERGITIELGFAQLELPDGTRMGVVDVPGHERFVRQMISGSTGIDIALLVIAADDGIMPQTVEHLAVLQTLGIASCVVALTKTDLVDGEWVAFMEDEVRERLANTPYAQAPIVAVSSRTGEGLDDLRLAIQDACAHTVHNKFGRRLRMPIDRVFTIKGAGTVVTGTLWSGTAHPGDTAEILPGSLTSRIRSVQMHNRSVEAAPAGNRVALNLPDAKRDELHPGDWVQAPGLLAPTDRFDARLTYLDTAQRGKPLETGVRMHIAHGTREVLGRVLLCNGVEQLTSGESAIAQIRLEEPLPIGTGDRFIVRTYSPVAVAGGGMALMAYPRRRTSLSTTESALLEALEQGDLATAAIRQVEAAGTLSTAAEVSRAIGAEPETIAELLDAAVGDRLLTRLDAASNADAGNGNGRTGGNARALYASKSLRQRLVAKLEQTLITFHTAHPGEAGMPKAVLARQCAPQLEPWRFDALIDEAVAAGIAVVSGSTVGHPSSQRAAREAEEQAAQALLTALEGGGTTPSDPAHLFAQAGLDDKAGHHALTVLERDGRAVRIADGFFLSVTALASCKQAVAAHLQRGGAGTVAALKDAMGTSRKYAVPLLEYLDEQGFTVRNGDERTLG